MTTVLVCDKCRADELLIFFGKWRMCRVCQHKANTSEDVQKPHRPLGRPSLMPIICCMPLPAVNRKFANFLWNCVWISYTLILGLVWEERSPLLFVPQCHPQSRQKISKHTHMHLYSNTQNIQLTLEDKDLPDSVFG